MVNTMNRLDPQMAFQYFGDWTDRIAKGEPAVRTTPRDRQRVGAYRGDLMGWSRPTALHA